jgi:ectoine hydroxylase-related dioxygenase (phytanoyl-CoA dioxygenase family)
MKNINLNELRLNGYNIVKNVIPNEWIEDIRKSVDESFDEHRKIQINNNNDIKTEGVALHVLVTNPMFIKILYHLLDFGFIQELETNFFKSNCILNSFSALNNIPNQPNFSSTIHRDLRFYSGEFPMMLNCLIMIDDFTIENGATYLLPKSHLVEKKPTDLEFYKNSIQAIGNSGDILIFNANVWHASAPNTTNLNRRALPFTISKSFMKQLLDYPRALGYGRMDEFTEKMQQLLGYHSRVPASLDEWYQPESKRFYKKDQD